MPRPSISYVNSFRSNPASYCSGFPPTVADDQRGARRTRVAERVARSQSAAWSWTYPKPLPGVFRSPTASGLTSASGDAEQGAGRTRCRPDSHIAALAAGAGRIRHAKANGTQLGGVPARELVG